MNKNRNIVDFPDAASVEEEAAAWVARIDTQPLSATEQAEFSKWVRQSAMHREAVERITTIWRSCDMLDELNSIDPVTNDEIGMRSASRRTVMIGGALAASLMLVVALAVLAGSGWFVQTQKEVYRTAIGEQRTIPLIDGSAIILNTDSEIEVDLGKGRRDMRLARGEASFDVAKDRRRPFRVYAGDRIVQAVGTSFAVYLRDDGVEVTVSEGDVKLLTSSHPKSSKAPLGDGGSPQASTVSLTANDNAVVDGSFARVERMSAEAIERKLLWREGLVGFAGEPLSAVISEVSRYTDINIEIEDPALAETPIGGFFKVGDVDGLFDALETVFDVDVERVNAKHVKLVRSS